jgi:UDP-glucose 4-epimerase
MRFFKTIGPRQTGRYGMVIPRFVRQALANEPITIYGDGEQSRCFADVADIIGAIYKISSLPAAVGQVFNVGSTEEVTIHELAERVIAASSSQSRIIYVPYEEAYAPGFEDMRRRVPDLAKVHQLIGYEPQFTLADTLKRVIDYERQQILKQSKEPTLPRPSR